MIMKQEINSNLLAECMKEAMKVEFLETNEEISYMLMPCIMRKCGGRV